ncbi:MAG: hypothetical protein QGD96_01330 [Anaerolineae bacterium]|nr:hypothetical protein [Anaerolineae bacterium]
MPIINLDKLESHRLQAFNLPPYPKPQSMSQAEEIGYKRGYTYFWPNKGIDHPANGQPWQPIVPYRRTTTSPGHITWGWKDDALDKRIWYYANAICDILKKDRAGLSFFWGVLYCVL